MELEFGVSNSVNVLAVRKNVDITKLDSTAVVTITPKVIREDRIIASQYQNPKRPLANQIASNGTALFQYDDQDDQDYDQADDGHQTPIIPRLAANPVQSSPRAVQAGLMALYVAVHPV